MRALYLTKDISFKTFTVFCNDLFQLLSTCVRICGQEQYLHQKLALTRALLDGARRSPSLSAATISHFNPNYNNDLSSSKTTSR